MPDERAREWLVEPLGSHDVRIHVDIGEDVEISDEARDALDTLVNELQASEVAGFAWPSCPSLKACSGYECGVLGRCQPLTKYPCFAEVQCKIQVT